MDVKTFRDNLFQMNTRRFGTVAETIIKKLTSSEFSTNIYHDLDTVISTNVDTRIEVKFSRVEKKHNVKITDDNVLDVIEREGLSVRLFPFGEWRQHDFDCNIQQIKKNEFDLLFYGLLFADRVVIFLTTPEEINNNMNYCDRQHKGNKGEGQFHITPKTLRYHMLFHHFVTLSYSDVLGLLSNNTN